MTAVAGSFKHFSMASNDQTRPKENTQTVHVLNMLTKVTAAPLSAPFHGFAG